MLSVDPDGAAPLPASLYIGGAFNSVGGVSAGNIARWAGCACYPNCDNSTGSPSLTANDFMCFINAFAAQTSYANCDNSTGIPALTANDFMCFINSFAAGCP